MNYWHTETPAYPIKVWPKPDYRSVRALRPTTIHFVKKSIIYDVRRVTRGDAIAIPPGTRQQITNTGDVPLQFLCCCAPAYEDHDTVLVDDWPL